MPNGALWQGDCRDMCREMDPDQVDACVTDPPYGLSFMGKGWDHGVPGVEYWQAVYRVLKPGAPLLAFGGTRTHHRLACAIEDAGFEIRDCLMWLYAQGFPKSLDVSKALDKVASPDAMHWDGYGTALKPAWENITWARKPLDDSAEWDIIVGSLIKLETQLCLLLSDALIATRFSLSSQGVQKLLNIAQWTADDRISTQGDLCGQMDMLRFESAVLTCLNTVSSWKAALVGNSNEMRISITGTKIAQTTDWKILRSCLLEITLPTIIKAVIQVPGSWWTALRAAKYLNAAFASIGATRELSVLGPVIANELEKCPDSGGVALSPSWEPVILARKPLIGTVAANVLKHGVGGLNIDGCRVGTADTRGKRGTNPNTNGTWGRKAGVIVGSACGRHPANLILDEEAGALLDEQSGVRNTGGVHIVRKGSKSQLFLEGLGASTGHGYSDKGGASRFFYSPKVSKRERGDSKHPTMKPLALMRYLVRLVSPPGGGLILDPFMGSGSTGLAAVAEGQTFVGAELEEESFETAMERMK